MATFSPSLEWPAIFSWFRDQRLRGIGSSTLKALVELDAGGHWATVGATGERAAGNGAAIRIAPLAFVLDADSEADRRTIRDVCRITHRHDEAYVGALAMVRSIQYVLAGNPLDARLFMRLVETLPDSVVRDRIIAIDRSAWSPREFASRFGASGYVAESVPLALAAAVRSSSSTSLLSGIQTIVECGGDTDSTASMFGQVFGAAFGTRVLPVDVIDRVDAASLIRTAACDVSRLLDERKK